MLLVDNFCRGPVSRENAERSCRNMGKSLLEVSSQGENDIISELMLRKGIISTGELSSVWTKTPSVENILGKYSTSLLLYSKKE